MEVKQGKFWCFTNFKVNFDYELWKDKFDYLIYGVEVCPKTGNIHHQGYVEFKSNQRISGLKKLDEKIHWEYRKGTREQAIEYCEKDGNTFEFGELKAKEQDKRNDIANVKKMVIDGKNMREISLESESYQCIKFAETLLKYHEIKRDFKPTVKWFFGESGSGKTKKAIEEAGNDYWISSRNLKWWDGYDAHENIIIDDFRGDFCTFHELLRILDRYPFRVEVKGGSRELLAKNIWITSPFHPQNVYKTKEDCKQLLRRLDQIVFFGIEDLGLKSGVILDPDFSI